MAAVAQLRTQTVRAVGELRDAVEAVDLHEMHRNAETGRGRAPAARAKQDRPLTAQAIIEFTQLARDLIFTLLRQVQIRFDLNHDGITDGQADVSAHEVAARAEIKLLHIRHDAGRTDAARLQRSALEEIDAVIAVLIEVAGILDINRVAVLLLEHTHHLCHDIGEVSIAQ